MFRFVREISDVKRIVLPNGGHSNNLGDRVVRIEEGQREIISEKIPEILAALKERGEENSALDHRLQIIAESAAEMAGYMKRDREDREH